MKISCQAFFCLCTCIAHTHGAHAAMFFTAAPQVAKRTPREPKPVVRAARPTDARPPLGDLRHTSSAEVRRRIRTELVKSRRPLETFCQLLHLGSTDIRGEHLGLKGSRLRSVVRSLKERTRGNQQVLHKIAKAVRAHRHLATIAEYAHKSHREHAYTAKQLGAAVASMQDTSPEFNELATHFARQHPLPFLDSLSDKQLSHVGHGVIVSLAKGIVEDANKDGSETPVAVAADALTTVLVDVAQKNNNHEALRLWYARKSDPETPYALDSGCVVATTGN